MRLVQVVAHSPVWSKSFHEEADRLRALLESEVLAVHHIGSTAIPDICAKPIIDILVEVRAIDRIDHFNAEMRQHGYLPKGEYGMAGRRFFIKGDEERRTHHVHVFERGHSEVARHLNFRDYLRAHRADAARYGALKADLAGRFSTDIEAYQAGKAELIRELDRKAALWVLSSDADQATQGAPVDHARE
ncbi:MAG: GrpB family protein [bacterium]|nr:GrpB family protein [bacterium]